jgi:large subunit ribosomal protein L21
MYAVIKTGGKQYRVAEGDLVKVEKIAGKIGDAVEFKEILLVANGEKVDIGRPSLDNYTVVGEILEQKKDKKVVIFKAKRRKSYRKRQGHRQNHTILRITAIKV